MHGLELPLLGGALIGLSAVLLMATLGEVAGISGIAAALLPPARGGAGWRAPFVVGLLAGPLLAALAFGHGFVAPPSDGAVLLLAAGALVGVGTGISGGCTSGHGVCGIARLSVRSLCATGAFMATAVATVFLVRHVL
jgi:uncharacterized membrane protein YedE/YeeE